MRRFAARLPDEFEELLFRCPRRVVGKRDPFRADIAGTECPCGNLLERGAEIFFLVRVERLGRVDLCRDEFFRAGKFSQFVRHI